MVVAVLGGVRSGWYVGVCVVTLCISVLGISVLLRGSYSMVMSFVFVYLWWLRVVECLMGDCCVTKLVLRRVPLFLTGERASRPQCAPVSFGVALCPLSLLCGGRKNVHRGTGWTPNEATEFTWSNGYGECSACSSLCSLVQWSPLHVRLALCV